MLVEELTTGKELVVLVESLSAHVNHVVSPIEIGAYKLLILVNQGFQRLAQVQRFLEHVVVNLTTTQVGKASAHAHVKGLKIITDGTEQVAAGYGDTIEASINLVILVLGEHTLISHKVVSVILVADTQLTALTQCIG